MPARPPGAEVKPAATLHTLYLGHYDSPGALSPITSVELQE